MTGTISLFYLFLTLKIRYDFASRVLCNSPCLSYLFVEITFVFSVVFSFCLCASISNSDFILLDGGHFLCPPLVCFCTLNKILKTYGTNMMPCQSSSDMVFKTIYLQSCNFPFCASLPTSYLSHYVSPIHIHQQCSQFFYNLSLS